MIECSTNQRRSTAKGLLVQVSDMPTQSPTLESSTNKKVIVAPVIILMLLIGAGFGWMAGAGLYNTVYRPIAVPNDSPASMSDQPDTTSQPMPQPEPRREISREARGTAPTRLPRGLTSFRAFERILRSMVPVGHGRGHHGKHHH